MLHKNFFDIIEGIYKRNMFVEEINTNGYYITAAALERLKKIGCIPLMKISLDGLGFHDWMRNREGAEENALNAIKLCIENGFPVKVQTNVNRKNLDSMLKCVLSAQQKHRAGFRTRATPHYRLTNITKKP